MNASTEPCDYLERTNNQACKTFTNFPTTKTVNGFQQIRLTNFNGFRGRIEKQTIFNWKHLGVSALLETEKKDLQPIFWEVCKSDGKEWEH